MRRNRRKQWLISLLFGALLAVLLLIGRGGLVAESQEDFLLLLCDALFVPGVLLAGMGLLVVVTGEGAFDAIRYGLQKLFGLLRSEEKRAKLPKTYFDFVHTRHAEPSGPPWAMLAVGSTFLLAAGIVLIFYYRTLV